MILIIWSHVDGYVFCSRLDEVIIPSPVSLSRQLVSHTRSGIREGPGMSTVSKSTWRENYTSTPAYPNGTLDFEAVMNNQSQG